MKVLLLGATGNVGSRLVPALLTHGHQVVAYVRSSKKLESLLPPPVFEKITVVQGDATDSGFIKTALLDNKCDAVINTAGNAALAPWGKSDLPEIFRAVVDAVQQAGVDRGSPLRAWFLGGLGVLYCPGTKSMLSNYIPIFLAHRQDLKLLKSLPPNAVDWSLLCPSTMTPESSDFNVPTKSSRAKLTASAGVPPLWNISWVKSIPLIGTFLSIMMNASRYDTTLEQNADFIAGDLESRDSQWIGTTVGIIDGSK